MIDSTSEFKKLAAHLYVNFAAQKESNNWDWNPVASRACDAAESFTKIFIERYPSIEIESPEFHPLSDQFLQPDVPSPATQLTQPDVPSPTNPPVK
jgi:hypothetical protein